MPGTYERVKDHARSEEDEEEEEHRVTV